MNTQPSVEVKPGFDAYGTPGFWVIADREKWVILLYREMAEAEAARLRVDMLAGFVPYWRRQA